MAMMNGNGFSANPLEPGWQEGSQAEGRAYLVALPHGRGVSAGVQSLEGEEVKLRVRVVSDFMDDLLGRKRLR